MITSTSINAAFIAKLVHAANVAIACESYCEIRTSKGKPSVLVEFIPNGLNSSLRFTHVSGQDITIICWNAISHLVTPLVTLSTAEVELVPVESMTEQEEPSSYRLIQAYLLFVMLGILVALDILSWGAALLNFGFAVVAYRLMPLLSGMSNTDPTVPYSVDMA